CVCPGHDSEHDPRHDPGHDGVGPAVNRRGPRRVWAVTPLWLRLVAAVLVLVAVALGAAGVATVTALHGYLLDEVDHQLRIVGEPVRHGLPPGPGPPPLSPVGERGGSGRIRLPSAFSLAITDQTGAVIDMLESPMGYGQPGPVFPPWTPDEVAAQHGRA